MKMLQRILLNKGGRSLTLMKIQISLWTSDDTELVIEEEEPTKVVEDQGSGEKGEKEVTTPVNFQTYLRRRRGVSTASRLDGTAASEIGSTTGVKAKDKGKAIIIEIEPEKKSKRQLEQERLDFKEALQENILRAIQEQEKQRVVTEADSTKVIDWSDPFVIRYHAQLNRPRSVAKDQVQEFVPMDSELEIPRLKRKGQEVQEEPAETHKTETKQVKEEIIQKRDIVDE
ncbi:hypothetical protein Tco_0030066 [Tanacetum coccineum]